MSATVIDALVVTLGLEAKKFQDGRKKAEKEHKAFIKNIKDGNHDAAESGETLSGSIEKVAGTVGKFLSVLGGERAFRQFIEDLTDSNAAMGRMAKNLDTTADVLSSWSGAVTQAGGDGKAAVGTMQMLSSSMTELQVTGNAGILPYMRALGVAMADTNGHARPLDDILLDLSDALTKLPDRATANNLGKMMGIDQDTLNLLLRGRKEVEAMLVVQKKLGIVTQKNAEASGKLQESWRRLGLSMHGIGLMVGNFLTPALTAISKAFEYLEDHQGLVIGFFSALALFAGYAALSLLPLIGEIALFAAPFVVAGAAIGLFWDDWATWTKGGESAFGSFYEAVSKIWKQLMETLSLDAFKAQWVAFKAWILKNFPHTAKAFGVGQPTQEQKTDAEAQKAFNEAKKNPNISKADAMKYFISQGWSTAQAAGIVANLSRESGLDPTARGDNGKAYGIGQWHPDRQANFQRFAGKSIQSATAMDQLAFVQYELTKGSERAAGERLRGSDSAYAAGAAISRYYERPALAGLEAAQRGTAAAQLAGQSAGPSNYVETHVGTLIVQTKATDAAGIARDIVGSLRNQSLANQSDSGMM